MECPSDDTLVAYKAKLLDADAIRQVELHIESCAPCRNLLMAWMRAENESAVYNSGADMVRSDGTPLDEVFQEEKDPPSLSRGESVGRYLILERLGAGGMGIVYAAYDPELDRKVALKMFRADYRAVESETEVKTRLRREAQAMAKVTHPNVVSVFDAQLAAGQVVIAMEYVEGETLDVWIEKEQRSWRDVLEKFLQAAAGLAAVHDAGLVHRDFKPGNVLIGKDGRACVTDFGLVRRTGDVKLTDSVIESTGNNNRCALAQRVTKTGMVLGTPAYMSPEQAKGQEVDARSDQFSYCVALWEALYGERPFPGATVEELQTSTLSGHIAPPPRGLKVPSWVRVAVTRGLNAEPGERYPTMHELRQRLAHDPAAARRRSWTTLGVVVLLLVAVFGTFLLTRTPSTLCKGADAHLVGVWDASAKAKARQTFLKSGRPYAADTFQRVEEHVDAWSKEWVTHHTKACEATHVEGKQSSKTLDRRMWCLDGKLDELKALVDVFVEKPDPEVVDKAVEASLALGRIAFCGDVEALEHEVPPPENLETRQAVKQLQRRLARVRQREELGKYKEAEAILTEVGPKARSLDYPPLRAEVVFLAGQSKSCLGEYDEAEGLLIKALQLGLQQWNQRDIALEASQELTWLVGIEMARPEVGWSYAQTSWGLSRGLGDEREARTLRYLGGILWRQGKYEEAEAKVRRALELAEEALGVGHPESALARGNLAILLRAQGKYAESEAEHRKVIEAMERVLGARNPKVGRFRNNFGTALGAQGKFGEAEEQCRRALEVYEDSLGAEHPDVAYIRSTLATVFRKQGRFQEAEAEYLRTLGLFKRAFGPDHPDFARDLTGLGIVFWKTKRYPEAQQHLRRALSICKKKTCPSDVEPSAHFAMADMLWEEGQERSRAVNLAQKARQGFAEIHRDGERAEVETWLEARGVKLEPIGEAAEGIGGGGETRVSVHER